MSLPLVHPGWTEELDEELLLYYDITCELFMLATNWQVALNKVIEKAYGAH
jgi:hypothetical protein